MFMFLCGEAELVTDRRLAQWAHACRRCSYGDGGGGTHDFPAVTDQSLVGSAFIQKSCLRWLIIPFMLFAICMKNKPF